MAAATYSVTTSGTDINGVWRKIQAKVAEAIRHSREEYDWFEDFPVEDVDWSHRETLVPLNINEEIGIATVPEGGKLARPSSVDLEEISISLTHFNGRFTASNLAKWADKGMSNQVEKQLRLQATNKVNAIGRRFSDMVYGTSVGTIALTDTDIAGASTATLVLKDGYGKTDIDTAAYLADKFRAGEFYALVDGSTLVTNGIFSVDASGVDATNGQIDVTFQGNVTESDNNLKIVYANNLENTTLSGGTDYNRGLVGFVDVLTTAAVSGLTHDNWDVSFEDTTGGRLDSSRLRKCFQTISNYSNKTPNRLLLAQGVERDLVLQERSLVRYGSPMGMELDGSVKMKGLEVIAPRNMLPKHAIMYNTSVYKKVALLPKPQGQGGLSWKDGYQMQDDDGMIFRADLVLGLFTNNRKAFGYFEALTEAA
jgi:hypothetical protein